METQISLVAEWSAVKARPDSERDRMVAELFDRHYDDLCGLAYVILRDSHAAEEIVMEALVKTFTGWGRIRDVSRSDAYVKRAVVNLCRSRIRRKGIESRANTIVQRAEETRPPDWDPDVHETQREVWSAVSLLPPRQRIAITLFYMKGMREAEIAETMDCSVGTVRSQLSRARAKLKVTLEERGINVEEGVFR